MYSMHAREGNPGMIDILASEKVRERIPVLTIVQVSSWLCSKYFRRVVWEDKMPDVYDLYGWNQPSG